VEISSTEPEPDSSRSTVQFSGDMPDSAPRLALAKLRTSLDLWSRNFDLPFPAGPLYHYTTISGLLGILSSGRLWATHTQFLNDPRETTYGTEVLNGCISRVMASVYFPEIQEALKSLPDVLRSLPSASSYITCFTEIPDSLVLWNMYTPESSGVAIEFDSVRLFAFARHAYALTRVCYEPIAQLSLIEGHIRSWVKIVEDSYNSHSGRLSAIIKMMVPELVARMYCFLPSLKSPVYSHEQEWRLIAYVTGNERVLFRALTSSLVPYVELGFGSRLPISGLVIGPNCPHPDRTRLSLEMIMAKTDYEDCSIRLSGLPYIHSAKR
jgi:hypothetical protein